MSKRLVALPVAMIAIAVFVPGIANATNFNTSATIAIQGPTGNSFGGKVNSSRAFCKSNRTVTLQRKSPGAANFVSIGSDKSASNGDWEVNTNPIAGAQYRAQVAVKNVSGGDRCVAATSTTVVARPTTNTIAIGTPAGASFRGTVDSTVVACESSRLVTLQRKLPGGSFTNLGNDTTAANGVWEEPTSPVNNAQYKGFVSARQAGSNACMAINSPVTTARNSTLTIQQGGSTNFHGTVNSVTACESNRTVTLQRKTIYETAFNNIGSDATNASGAWQVNTTVISGASYRAFVGARQVGANSCLDDFSNTVVAS
jgi:hypothetical protein